jgi:hypothetical protein
MTQDSQTSVVIKFVEADKLDSITPLATQFWQEGKLIGKYDESSFVENWKNLINQDVGRILGAYRNDKLIGILGFVASKDPNDNALVSQEMFWFVDPQYRKGEGLLLFNEYEKIATDIGVKRIGMVHLDGIHSEKLEKLYKKRGYRTIEKHYMKEIK